jgi:8-oxo-dGTP pyrophosphatase MutT (NUDIX family)
MVKPKILVSGYFNPQDVVVSYSEISNRKIVPNIENQIEEVWENMQKHAKEKGQNIWNGTSYRVNQVALTKDKKLTVEFAPIEFKVRDGLIEIPEYFSLPEECWRKGAFTGALVKTVDGFYMFVKLSGISNNPSSIDWPGGILGDEGPIKTGADLFADMLRELEEETTIPSASVESCVLRAVYISASTNVGFIFDITLFDTKDVVHERFKERNEDEDINDLLFVPVADIRTQLESMSAGKQLICKELLGG